MQNSRVLIVALLLLSAFIIQSCSKGGNSSGNNPTSPIPSITITSLSVTHGNFGTKVAISGTGFDINTKFYINGNQSPVVLGPTSTQVTITVPLAAGSGNVTATSNSFTATGPAFTYDKALCITTVAGNGSLKGFSDGNGTSAQFYEPIGLVLDKTGNLFVADSRNNRIRKIAPNGTVTTYAGSGVAGSADGVGTSATFWGPSGLAIDQLGILYVSDTNNGLIRKIGTDGTVTTIAGGASPSTLNGTGKNSSFNQPGGLAVDASGNIFVADEANSLIRKITPAAVVTTFAGMPGLAGNSDGTGANASFNGPAGLSIDKSGNLFVIERASGSIRKITPQAAVTKFQAIEAYFKYPAGILCTDNGDIYIADTFESVIKLISNSITSLFMGIPNATFTSTDGAKDKATLIYPVSIVTDGNGTFYFTDQGSSQVKKISYQ